MVKRVKFLVFFSCLLVFASGSAKAWDDAGHKTTAYIAWRQMSPEARERAFNILMNAPEDADLSVFYLQDSRSADVKKRELFMIASTWADIVRDRRFPKRAEKYHHSNWHYDDTFWTFENDQIRLLPNPAEDGGKAVEKLSEFDRLLKDAAAADAEKAVALAWVLHLGGDIHQPLHTSARVTELEPKGDQGGNLFLLTPKDLPRERSENLHWFWDSILGRIIPRNDMADAEYIALIGESIMRKYPPAEMENRLKTGNFREWQEEGVRLAMTEVFSPDLVRFETPSAKYRRNAFAVSEEQMALAGYRLGAMLNRIFGGQIKEVSANSNEKAKSNIGQGANDLWIWTKVRAALALIDELRSSTINVEVESDVVSLKGSVGSEEQKRKAVETAKQIEGVKQVLDLLKISN